MRKRDAGAGSLGGQGLRGDVYPNISIVAFAAACLWAPAHARAALADDPRTAVPCPVTLWETPFNAAPGAWPSMNQSRELSACTYALAHRAIPVVLTGHPSSHAYSLGVKLALVGFDFAMGWLPLGNAWVHEEWHRAVMATRGIPSYDEVYEFRVGAETISVSHVSDARLARLKKDHNPDLVRLGAAGVEGETELTLGLEKTQFAHDWDIGMASLYMFNALQTAFYISSGSDRTPDQLKDEFNGREPREAQRDFVGHDFSSWVYDLFRPDEPYEARGKHPSGNGVDRYRGRRDLRPDERKFLRLEGVLTWLNLVDPFLWGIDGFAGAESWGVTRWNARMAHFLTSFGHDVQGAAFLADAAGGSRFVALHVYANGYRSFPGVEWQELTGWRWGPWSARARAMLWEQPWRQRFRTRSGRVGGLASVTLARTVGRNLEGFTALTGKSEGWVAGNPYLDKNLMWQTGIQANL